MAFRRPKFPQVYEDAIKDGSLQVRVTGPNLAEAIASQLDYPQDKVIFDVQIGEAYREGSRPRERRKGRCSPQGRHRRGREG